MVSAKWIVNGYYRRSITIFAVIDQSNKSPGPGDAQSAHDTWNSSSFALISLLKLLRIRLPISSSRKLIKPQDYYFAWRHTKLLEIRNEFVIPKLSSKDFIGRKSRLSCSEDSGDWFLQLVMLVVRLLVKGSMAEDIRP